MQYTKFSSPEARRNMSRQIFMPFFKSVVFLDVMKIVTADYDRSLHFHLFNNSCQNTTPDTDVACEWTFLVNVMSINCLKKMTIHKYLKHTFIFL